MNGGANRLLLLKFKSSGYSAAQAPRLSTITGLDNWTGLLDWEKINVIMTLGGRGSRTMIRSALFRNSFSCYVETTDEKKNVMCCRD